MCISPPSKFSGYTLAYLCTSCTMEYMTNEKLFCPKCGGTSYGQVRSKYKCTKDFTEMVVKEESIIALENLFSLWTKFEEETEERRTTKIHGEVWVSKAQFSDFIRWCKK